MFKSRESSLKITINLYSSFKATVSKAADSLMNNKGHYCNISPSVFRLCGMIDLKWQVHKKTHQDTLQREVKMEKHLCFAWIPDWEEGITSMQWRTLCLSIIQSQPKALDVSGSISMIFGLGFCIEWYLKGEERAGRERNIRILEWNQEVKAWQP